MRATRFSKLLLVGKAATLPVMLNQAKAESVTPGYSDIISSDLRVIQIPSGSAVQLASITADSNTSSTSYAAQMCTNATLPSTMTIVVTGVKQGETVIVAAASDKNNSVNLAFDSRLTIGSTNLKLLAVTQVQAGSGTQIASAVTTSVAMTVDTTTLKNLASNGKYYIQAATVGGSSMRFSELDEITVGTCQSSSYGYGTTGY